MSRLFRLCFALAFASLFLVGGASLLPAQELEPPSAEEVEAARSAPLFTSHDALELTIEADFHTIRREDRKQDSKEERPAVLRWTTADGSTGSLDIQVRTRGNFRLSRRNCDFPPLRLNLKKGSTKGTLFEGQDKLKLVVTCKLGQDYWEQYVLLEYMAYRTLNVLTDISFRVRLAKVTYVDTSGEDDTFTRYAFLIEDAEMMALRQPAQVIEWVAGQLHPSQVEKHQAIIDDVYQYMIGNTDWAALRGPDPKECCHNIKLIGPEPLGSDQFVVPVPYDFDSSGLVDARYAAPHEALGLKSVTDRLYRGYCMHNETLESARQQVLRQEAAIRGLVANEGRLSSSTKKKAGRYLEDFFEIAEDPDKFEKNITEHCRR